VYRGGGGWMQGEATAPVSPQYGTTQWPQRSLTLERRTYAAAVARAASRADLRDATGEPAYGSDIGGRTDAYTHVHARTRAGWPTLD